MVEGINPEDGSVIYKGGKTYAQVSSEDDMEYVGDPFPDFTYGVTLTAAWKGFDFIAFGTGSQGNDIYLQATTPHLYGNKFYKVDYEGRWTPQNTTASKPGAMAMSAGNIYRYSNQRVFDGSYFRIKQIQLGYTLPASLTRKVAIQKMRLYGSLDDFWIFTKYPGLAPDVASDVIIGAGVDTGTTPTTRKVVFGLNITF